MSVNIIWRQHISVRGDSLRLLESVSDIASVRRDPTANTLILHGVGQWFPEMEGTDWVACCDERRRDDVALSDLTPILWLLLDSTMLPMSDAPAGDVAAWLSTLQGAAR